MASAFHPSVTLPTAPYIVMGLLHPISNHSFGVEIVDVL